MSDKDLKNQNTTAGESDTSAELGLPKCVNCMFFDTTRLDNIPGRGWCGANAQWVKEFEECQKFKFKEVTNED